MEHCFCLPKESFPSFFAVMRGFGTVYAPRRVSAQSFSFQAVDSEGDIAFDALRTILPPKKFFYKQKETLIKFDDREISAVEPPDEKLVLFGVHPCDLAGLGVLDTIFSAEPGDSHYMKRRQSTLIVGLSCLPDRHCFCQSMGTDSPRGPYDIFLTDPGPAWHYFVEVNTPMGSALVNANRDLFTSPSPAEKERYKSFWTERDSLFTNSFPSSNLTAILDMEWDNEIWDDLGKRCLSCGNCTPVCPTCYCFDITDIASLDGKSGERVREWDSCQFSGFAAVSGDFNFRPGPVDRLKFWYRHKLHGFDDPYGFPTCVGCGRCTVSCPAGIDDIVGVVLHLQGVADERDKEPS